MTETSLPLSQRAMMAQRPAPYLEGLNAAQRAAVEALDGPVLVLAGAGTGKTRVLTTRIANLLNTGKARPHEVLAVTFTNKAAREMKDRIGRLMGQAIEGMPWLGTFHSVAVKILRRHAELVGLNSSFTILDTDDQLRLMKQVIIARGIDEKKWPARQLASLIDHWKNRGWTPEQVSAAEATEFNRLGITLYKDYQNRLKDLNACDFGDLLLHCLTIFLQHPDVLGRYQQWFRYILVDEYQDTNVAQYLWLRLLAQGYRNICCVGDDDQSIYGWRGAEVGNILRFEKDFAADEDKGRAGPQVIRLEQNYRSTPHILAAASSVISGNRERLGKTLWTDQAEGEKVRLIGHWDGEEEARWIGEEAEALSQGRRPQGVVGLNDQAILVRASHQMRAFEDRFLTIGLPYRVIGGPRFYERLEIRDAMAYFRLAITPSDDLAFERIVNTPKRGLGDKAQSLIRDVARSHEEPLLSGARRVVDGGMLGGKGGAALRKFVQDMDRWHEEVLSARPVLAEDLVIEPVVPDAAPHRDHNHIRLAEKMLEESGYISMWQNDKTPEAEGRLENLKELVKALEEFESLQGFLEHVALIMDNEKDEASEKITIMTLHGAKGLEFPAVWLPGWEEGIFPSQRSLDETGNRGLEEERRLAYVGITRAEQLCTISFAANRRVFGQWQSQLPSRFIDELPEEHVDVLTAPGLYGGGYGAAAPSYGKSGIETRASEANVYNSPGWRRLQAQTAKPATPPRKITPPAALTGEIMPDFDPGARVFHQKFGYGTVVSAEGDKLGVEFDKAGSKHVMSSYVVAADAASDVPF